MQKPAEALEVFKLNFEKNGDNWPVHVGLARGYAATGDVKKALDAERVEQAGGGVGGVGDAAHRVAALARQVQAERAFRVGRERHALADQPVLT